MRASPRFANARSMLLASATVLAACAGSGSTPGPRMDAGATGGGSASSGGSTGTGGATGGAPSASGGAAAGGAGAAASGGITGQSGGGPGSTGGATGGTTTGGTGGGATGGAATGGMGGTTAGTGGAAGASACAGLVCEDFESGKVDAQRWETVAKGGTLSVQSTRVAHGTYALQVHGQSGSADDWALLVAKNVPAALAGKTTFGRAYVYVAAEATASIHVQLAFAGRNGTGPANGPAPFAKLRYMEVASYGGTWQLGFDLLDLSPLVEEVSYAKSKLPTKSWMCMEWQFEDQPDRVTLWLEGAQVATFDNSNVSYASPGPVPKPGAALWDGKSSDLIGGFDSFGFGFHDWHPQTAFDIYYDDLVLDAKRIGCLPAKP